MTMKRICSAAYKTAVILATLIFWFVIMGIGLTTCDDADAAELPPTVSLLAYSGEGATTLPVIVNPTDHDVKYPDSTVCSPLGCHTDPGIVIPAGKVVALDYVKPAAGIVGAYQVTLPDPGLVAYSQIVTGSGALFRLGPLTETNSVHYMDAIAAPQTIGGVRHVYNTWLIIIARDAMTIPQADGSHVDLNAGDGVLLPAPTGGNFTISSQFGKFYAVVGINDPVTGSQQLVRPY